MIDVDLKEDPSPESPVQQDLEDARRLEHKKRVRFGYMMALFCAIFWGLWYVPGEAIWLINPFDQMTAAISATDGDALATVIGAVVITGLNAIFVIIALLVWNGALGKLREMGRTVRQMRHCTKWFFLASIFGGPLAVLGSFLAMGFVGAAFAAVAGLMYPVVGSILAHFTGQKVSKRALLGILAIVIGGITVYAGGLIEDLANGGGSIWGYVGGIMAAIGWGTEGIIASKGLDVAEPDIGITLRFVGEGIIWWVIAIPILALLGYPVLTYVVQILDPLTIGVLIMLGITFGCCYVTWYKSFTLIGVNRGQGVGNLYGICAVIFLFVFMGRVPDWTIILGGILCIVGSLVMFTEGSIGLETLKTDEFISKEAAPAKKTSSNTKKTNANGTASKVKLRPIKFRILELYSDGEEHWNSEVVKVIQSEYGMGSGYGRDLINFDIIELAAGGLLKELAVAQDDGTYKAGALLHKYKITEFGKNQPCLASI